jgi:hypothetical protein
MIFEHPTLECSKHRTTVEEKTPSHPDVDIEGILSRLTLEEKVSLLSAKDWWRTPVINRPGVFVPHIKVSRV